MTEVVDIKPESKVTPGNLLRDLEIYLVYPGQPLIIANMIMLVFRDLPELMNGTAVNPPAIANQKIPGAGDAVSTTVRLLREGVEQNLSAKVMIDRLNNAFVEIVRSQEAFRDKLDVGLEKSWRFHTLFENIWPSWLHGHRENAGPIS